MEYEEVVEMIEKMGLPFSYHHFAEGEGVEPPFIVFIFPGRDDFFADGISYLRVERLHIELYTDLKDPEMEKKVEDTLDSYGLSYEKTETYIKDERLFLELYELEV